MYCAVRPSFVNAFPYRTASYNSSSVSMLSQPFPHTIPALIIGKGQVPVNTEDHSPAAFSCRAHCRRTNQKQTACIAMVAIQEPG